MHSACDDRDETSQAMDSHGNDNLTKVCCVFYVWGVGDDRTARVMIISDMLVITLSIKRSEKHPVVNFIILKLKEFVCILKCETLVSLSKQLSMLNNLSMEKQRVGETVVPGFLFSCEDYHILDYHNFKRETFHELCIQNCPHFLKNCVINWELYIYIYIYGEDHHKSHDRAQNRQNFDTAACGMSR